MKKVKQVFCLVSVIALVGLCACEEDKVQGPNEIGGETNLDLTREGGVFPISIGTAGFIPGLQALKDSIFISKNDRGIITVKSVFKFDTVFTNGLAQALGVEDLPSSARTALIDTYVKRFSATLDTTNKDAMSLEAEFKMKVTSEGIQEFVNSNGDLSRPFTIVKYNANVGDKYEFTNFEGVPITRTVVYKSTTDDYPVGFWRIKVLKVEEEKEDLLTEKITYVANHKFGLVGIIVKTGNGKEVTINIYPPTL